MTPLGPRPVRPIHLSTLIVIVVIAVASAAPAADTVGPVTRQLEQMHRWETTSAGLAIPAGGVRWTVDTATWTLESGVVRYLRPLADGTVTGFVFEGMGRFEMSVPDPFEVAQLQRFTDRPDQEAIDERFGRMVFRTSGALPEGLPDPPGEADYDTDRLLAGRTEEWLEHAWWDVDAQILAAHLNGIDEVVAAEMDTATFDWLMLDFDPLNREELQVTKLQKLNDFPEVWVSLDRASQRTADGRPGSAPPQQVDLVHVDLEIDLSDHAGSQVSRNRPLQPDWGSFRATVELEAVSDELVAPTLVLTPSARVTSAQTPDGVDLEVLRDHIGGRFLSIGNDYYDRQAVVILPAPVSAGETFEVVLEYEIEIYNFASGRSWYPTPASDVVDDLHTARMSFSLPYKFEVRAVGDEVKTTRSGRSVRSVWEVTRPTKMVGFSFGKGFKEERLEIDGVPEVVSFGDPNSVFSGSMVRNVGADVVNSLAFYQWFYNVQIPSPRVLATGITAAHGQAFEGFLHLAQSTFEGEHPGASELFRAHEVAHQLWGHMVHWESYRDQWLSESFAEYSAMLFIEATMADEGHFEDILKVYTSEQLGSLKGSMSKFARPWDVTAVRTESEYLGPIAAGFRASSSRLPSGYQIQVYRKGPLVLHMIRTLLRAMDPDRDLFRALLQEFLHTHIGTTATTEDFKELLERRTGRDWTPFFDAWIYGTAIPTYRWDWRLATSSEDGTVIEVEVRQKNVPEGFAAIVPIRVIERDGTTSQYFVRVSQPKEVFTVPVEREPEDVIFNPDYAVLADVDRI